MAVAAIWLLSILYTFSARAEEACPAFRLDQTPALQAIPRWDQEDSFLCYAFSASVLVDARRGGSTAPLALAADTVNFSRHLSRRSSLWGGNLDQSIQVAREKGTCRPGWISDRLGKVGLRALLPELRALQREARNGDPAAAAEKLKVFLRANGAGSLPEAKFLGEILAMPQDDFISELIGAYCVDRQAAPELQLLSEDRSYRPQKISFADRISGVLGNGSPLAAEFCAEVVTDPGFSPGYNSICSRHYVVVVGQRQAGRCELLIRDSQCSQYKGRAGNSGCEGSHYWIDRRAFLGNTQAVHWLK